MNAEHTPCRKLYTELCKVAGVKPATLTCYKYGGMHFGFQVYEGKKILGDFPGCCAWSAKNEMLIERIRNEAARIRKDNTP